MQFGGLADAGVGDEDGFEEVAAVREGREDGVGVVDYAGAAGGGEGISAEKQEFGVEVLAEEGEGVAAEQGDHEAVAEVVEGRVGGDGRGEGGGVGEVFVEGCGCMKLVWW